MVLDYRVNTPIGEGNYACVFTIADKVAKLFRRFPQFPPRQTERGRKLTFEAQVLAYEKASGDPFLRLHIPEFHGTLNVTEVLDKDGKSIGENFFLDHCYVLERLDGSESKFKGSGYGTSHPWLADAERRFANISITVLDASVFRADDPEDFKVIDFELATYVYERLDMRL